MEPLLLPCVGSEAGVRLARSLRLVDDLEVAPEEASPREHGDAGTTLWEEGAARRPVLAGWGSRAVLHGSTARAALPVGLDEDPWLRDKHQRRARCVTKVTFRGSPS